LGLAVAFAIRHPAVTSAIIGPRTMEHLDGYLAADGIELSTDVLDRIDEIVPPADPQCLGRGRVVPLAGAGDRAAFVTP
jgi:aryl-alcohol dehydrogenase-like predicted oxidoreductase